MAARRDRNFWINDNGDLSLIVGNDDGTNLLGAAPLGQGTVKQITATVTTTPYTISPATGTWRWLKVMNTHTTAILTVAINENPVAAPAATPGVAADWEAGYSIGPGGSEVISLTGTLTTIRLLSDTASTAVVLCLVA